MRGMAALSAALAGWALAGGRLPQLPALPVLRLGLGAWLAGAGLGIGTTLLGFGLTAVPAVAGSVGLLAAATPLVAAHLRKLHLREASRDQWPDFLTSLSAQLAGGGSLPESFVAAGERSGGPFREGAERIADATARGASFADALAGLRDVYQDPIADRILTTLLMAQRSGGHRVAAVLSGLASSIADELRLRKAHHAALTQQRLTAAVALLAPWVLLVLTVTSNPTAADAYRSGSGPSVVLGGLAATLAGYLLAARTARLPEPPRVFR